MRILRQRVNTVDTSVVPFTSSAAEMEAPPSVLLATHWYVPLSFFSAPATRKEPSPRVKKRLASTASESPLLTLRENHFTACHAAGALFNVPLQPSCLQCCDCHLFLPLEPIQNCRIFKQLTEYCSNYDKKIETNRALSNKPDRVFFSPFRMSLDSVS